MIINPHTYYYKTDESATLTCICEDGTIDPLNPIAISGRTIKIRIRRHSDNFYLNFTTGLWDNVFVSDDCEKIMTDNDDGTYLWDFNRNIYDSGEQAYTVVYIDKGETGDNTWGGTDYDILIFSDASYIPVSPTDPLKVNIYGWLLDNEGSPIEGALVTAILDREVVYIPTSMAVQRTLIKATTDSSGYWDLEVLPTDQLSPECLYKFTFNQRDTYYAQVPEIPSTINFVDLDYHPPISPI